jgi:pyridoxamine 5'-phosphate oxidase
VRVVLLISKTELRNHIYNVMLNQFNESSVNKNPFKQFTIWYKEALESNVTEPTAMILATSTKNSIPSARTVLLKGYDERGFVFHTNYKSRKAKELEENSNAELLFLWKEIERQVRVSGIAEKTSREESEEYFKTRPYESRIGAWASKQSSIIPGRDYLERNFAEFKSKFEGKEIPLPPFWGGFRILPHTFEFWQGRENRLHDRICYKKKNEEWEIVRLSP